MSKKGILICIGIALLLFAAIGWGVMRLYSGAPAAAESETSVSHAVSLRAVPADAALVFCFQNARSGVALLDDPSRMFRAFLGGNAAFGKFLAALPDSASLKSHPMAVSVHYSETLIPLMALETGHGQDTTAYERTLLDFAEHCGLQAGRKAGADGTLVLISPSGALVESACRHLDAGTSILDDPYFSELASLLTARDVVFCANSYLGKVLAALCQKPLYKHSTFLKGAAEWTGFAIRESSQKRSRLPGVTVSGRSPGYYANLLEALPAGELRFAQAVPANTVTALALSLPAPDAYVKAYEKWLDASQQLPRFRRDCDTLRARTGADPAEWFAQADICEVVKAVWLSPAGGETGVVLLRTAKAARGEAQVEPFAYADFPALVLGDAFACNGASCRTEGEWKAIGSEAALAEYAALLEEKGTLQAALSDVSETRLLPAKGSKAVFYFSASDAAARYGQWFRPLLANRLTASTEGVIREPLVLSCGEDGLLLEIARPVDYAERKASAKRTEGRKAEVEVPKGPFEVTNSGTGRTNLFYQAPNLSLCLKDKDSGKGLWGVSFDKPICGAAACVDYFANGKLQFLFAAGSKLYLIDRLGRFVSGFPVELGKDVLVGPAVYDFSGAGAYTALVLHRDNTIGMYDLHGVQPSAWKGITSVDTILGLPARAKADGKPVWVVKTAGGEQVFDFWGGEPLKGKALKNVVY